jgi:hypothetical protein
MRVLLALAPFCLLGCHDRSIGSDYFRETQAGQELLKRAAFDLSCPESELSVVQLAPSTAGVRGCSKQAAYVRERASWILDSSPRPVSQESKPSEAR